MNRLFLVVMVLVVAMVLPALGVHKCWAQDESQDQSDVSSKLDKVLANQKTIIDELAAMKQELNIIKIRITQQQ